MDTVAVHVRLGRTQFDLLCARARVSNRKIIDQIRYDLDTAQRLHDEKIAEARKILAEPVYDDKQDFGA